MSQYGGQQQYGGGQDQGYGNQQDPSQQDPSQYGGQQDPSQYGGQQDGQDQGFGDQQDPSQQDPSQQNPSQQDPSQQYGGQQQGQSYGNARSIQHQRRRNNGVPGMNQNNIAHTDPSNPPTKPMSRNVMATAPKAGNPMMGGAPSGKNDLSMKAKYGDAHHDAMRAAGKAAAGGFTPAYMESFLHLAHYTLGALGNQHGLTPDAMSHETDVAQGQGQGQMMQ